MLEPHLFPASAPGGLPISADAAATDKKVRRRSWASSDYLAERLQHFSTYMKVFLALHRTTQSLAAFGQRMTTWLYAGMKVFI